MNYSPTVKDYMAKKLHTLNPETNIYQAVNFLLKHQISGAPVIDNKHNLIGVISEKDCLHLLTKGIKNDIPEINVGDFMSKKVETLFPETDIYSAAEVFLKKTYRRFPVINKEGKLVGQISRRDILRAIKENLKSDKLRIIDADKAKKVDRKEIPGFKFPATEVLKSAENRKIRTIKLENATRLGNIERYKVKIVFEDSEDIKMVYTTIWHSTEKYISLKGGIRLNGQNGC